MDVFEQAARRGKFTFPFFPKTAPPYMPFNVIRAKVCIAYYTKTTLKRCVK